MASAALVSQPDFPATTMKVYTLCFCWNPETTEVLLQQRRADWIEMPGVLNGLGGKLQLGEVIETAGRREVWEESGLLALDLTFRGTESWICRRPDGSLRDQGTLFLATATQFRGALRPDCPEGTNAWYPLAAALEAPGLAPNLPVILPLLLPHSRQHYAGLAHYVETTTDTYALSEHGYTVW